MVFCWLLVLEVGEGMEGGFSLERQELRRRRAIGG
jgi:hypothetical protein